ncbi:Histidine kinase [bacterium A37T11]|nr:Histidine kinase [bacterium A37T11]
MKKLLEKFILWLTLCAILAAINILTAAVKQVQRPHYIAVHTIDFLSMALISVPFIWFCFYNLRKLSFRKKLIVQVLLCPVYIILWHLLTGFNLVLFGISDKMDFEKVVDPASLLQAIIYYVLAFGILNTYHFFLEQQALLKREKILQGLAHANELNALKAQIHPHFLFNTLTTISASVPAQQEDTRQLIAWLADTFRYSIAASKKEWLPLKDELHFIEAILHLEEKRFKERLTFEIVVDHDLDTLLVPPMIIQPFIENAIKHGIAPSIAGGKISLHITKEENFATIRVADTGIGLQADLPTLTSAGGIGIQNTQKRLLLIYNQPLHITQNTPSGFVFSFKIPLTHV